MALEGSYILVHLVEPHEPGYRFERRRMAWPLHVTLMSWFRVHDEPSTQQALQELAHHTQPFVLTVGQEALFGHDRDIPVNVVHNQAPFKRLHESLGQLLTRQAGFSLADDQWAGGAYTAHVTHHGEARLQVGDIREVNSMSLIRLGAQNICEVVANYSLDGQNP